MEDYGYIEDNFASLVREVGELGRRAGRNITLVAVTKSGSDAELLALGAAGVADVGENRPGELRRRGDLLKSAGFAPRLHEIGNLQRNKVKLIAPDVWLIHSLDTLQLAEEIDKQAKKCGRRIPVLIEINSGREESKGGVMPEEAEEFFLAVKKLENLKICGVMTMGPALDCPEEMRPYFRLTKDIYDYLTEKYGFEGEGILSMGMSDSYKVAIEEGATLVRIGRAFFRKPE